MVVSSLPPPPPPPPRRLRRVLRQFSCNEDLWRTVDARSKVLGCSVDFLIGEAMKRMLEVDRPALPTVALVCGDSRVVVDRDRVVIGRSGKEAQLVLRHEAVSRQHAIVERLGAVFWLVDMASTNGVMVNGKKATRAIIGPGDVLTIGPFTIAVERA
jgi:hypothetical protein